MVSFCFTDTAQFEITHNLITSSTSKVIPAGCHYDAQNETQHQPAGTNIDSSGHPIISILKFSEVYYLLMVEPCNSDTTHFESNH